MSLSPKEFKDKTYNKSFDYDGMYGQQCWDLWAYFCSWQKIPVYNCYTTGYVIDIWNNRYNSGILKYFDIVDKKNLQNGDWVIFPKSYTYTPYSHIGMYYDGKLLGQNQPQKKTTLSNAFDFNKSCGGLRFKNYPKPKTDSSLKVGDKVKIVSTGNSQANGNGTNAYGIGWTREILKIYSNQKFQYQVGNKTGTTGFYKKGALKKV